MDGYFPSEFRDQHPDGVFLELLDRSQQDFSAGCADDVNGRMDKNQLLRRLPKTVIRQGQLIEVRAGIDSILSGNESSSTTTTTTTNIAPVRNNKGNFILLSTPASQLSDNVNPNNENIGNTIVQIQIKWLDGSSFLAKMFENDSVEDLKNAIVKNFEASSILSPEKLSVKSFELRNAYPSRVLVDSKSLKEEGLVPNGTVHAKKK